MFGNWGSLRAAMLTLVTAAWLALPGGFSQTSEFGGVTGVASHHEGFRSVLEHSCIPEARIVAKACRARALVRSGAATSDNHAIVDGIVLAIRTKVGESFVTMGLESAVPADALSGVPSRPRPRSPLGLFALSCEDGGDSADVAATGGQTRRQARIVVQSHPATFQAATGAAGSVHSASTEGMPFLRPIGHDLGQGLSAAGAVDAGAAMRVGAALAGTLPAALRVKTDALGRPLIGTNTSGAGYHDGSSRWSAIPMWLDIGSGHSSHLDATRHTRGSSQRAWHWQRAKNCQIVVIPPAHQSWLPQARVVPGCDTSTPNSSSSAASSFNSSAGGGSGCWWQGNASRPTIIQPASAETDADTVDRQQDEQGRRRRNPTLNGEGHTMLDRTGWQWDAGPTLCGSAGIGDLVDVPECDGLLLEAFEGALPTTSTRTDDVGEDEAAERRGRVERELERQRHRSAALRAVNDAPASLLDVGLGGPGGSIAGRIASAAMRRISDGGDTTRGSVASLFGAARRLLVDPRGSSRNSHSESVGSAEGVIGSATEGIAASLLGLESSVSGRASGVVDVARGADRAPSAFLWSAKRASLLETGALMDVNLRWADGKMSQEASPLNTGSSSSSSSTSQVSSADERFRGTAKSMTSAERASLCSRAGAGGPKCGGGMDIPTLPAIPDPMELVMGLLKAIMGILMPIIDGLLSPILAPILEVIQTMLQEFIQPMIMGGGGTFISQLLGLAMAIAQMVMAQIQAMIAAAVAAALKAMAGALSGMAGKLGGLSAPALPMPGMPPMPQIKPKPVSIPRQNQQPQQQQQQQQQQQEDTYEQEEQQAEPTVTAEPVPSQPPRADRPGSPSAEPSPDPSPTSSPVPSASSSPSSVATATPTSPARSFVKGWFARAPAVPLSDEVLARARGDAATLLQEQEGSTSAKKASRLRGGLFRRSSDPRATALLGAASLLQTASSRLEKRASSDAESLTAWFNSKQTSQSASNPRGQEPSVVTITAGATSSNNITSSPRPERHDGPQLSNQMQSRAVSLAAAMVRDAATKAAVARGVDPIHVVTMVARETKRSRQAERARSNADRAEQAAQTEAARQATERMQEELSVRSWSEGGSERATKQLNTGYSSVEPAWITLQASQSGSSDAWAELLAAEPTTGASIAAGTQQDTTRDPSAESDPTGRSVLCAAARRMAAASTGQGVASHSPKEAEILADMLCASVDGSDGSADSGKLAKLDLLRGWHTGRASQWAAELASDPQVLAHAARASRQSSAKAPSQPDDDAIEAPPQDILVQRSGIHGQSVPDGGDVLLQTASYHTADPDTHAAASLKLHDQAYLDKNKKPKNAGQAKNKGGEAPGGAGAKMTQDVAALLRDNLAVAAIRYLPAQLVTTGAAAVTESTVNVLTRWIRPRLHSKIHKGVAAKLRLRLSKTLSRAVTTRVVRDTHAALERDLSQGLSRLLPLILAPATADLTNYRPEKDWYCAICKATKGKGDLYCQYCKNPDTGMWNVQVVQAQYYAAFYGSHAAALHPIKIIPASKAKDSA